MIDIGANLTNRQFQRDLPQVLRRARDAGVLAVVVTGTSARISADAVRLASRQASSRSSPRLFATVGVHPHDAKGFQADETLAEIRALVAGGDGVVVALGECGLDFNRNFSSREQQERAFRAQVELACELRLPLFLHEREAHAAFVGVLDPFRQQGRLPPVVVHCFTGTEQELRAYVALGFYIGVTGFVCMDSRGFKLRQMASLIPLDRLMVETDAPYMYPYSGSGGKNARARCEPKDVRAVIETLASCYNTTPEEIERHTTSNATRFFQLERHLVRSEVTPPPAPLSEKTSSAVTDLNGLVEVDGGSGEGGGQLLRISMALAALLKLLIRIRSVRAARKVPGLRNQHLATVEFAQKVSGGFLEGAHVSSTELLFDARSTDAGVLRGELGDDGRVKMTAEAKTGGSVSLMVQGALPIVLFGHGPTSMDITLMGGTHVSFSPTIDYMQVVLRDLLSRFGAQISIDMEKRMFTPGSSRLGKIMLSVEPADAALSPVDLSISSSEIARVFTRVTVMGMAATDLIAQRVAEAMKTSLTEKLGGASTLDQECMEWASVVERSGPTADAGGAHASKNSKQNRFSKHHRGKGPSKSAMSVLCVVHTSSGGILSVDRTIVFASAQDAASKSPELAKDIANYLSTLLRNGVCVDEHLADNAVVYMALARGTSRLRVPKKSDRTSHHLETALDMVHRLAGAEYRVHEELTSAVIEVDGIGLAPPS